METPQDKTLSDSDLKTFILIRNILRIILVGILIVINYGLYSLNQEKIAYKDSIVQIRELDNQVHFDYSKYLYYQNLRDNYANAQEYSNYYIISLAILNIIFGMFFIKNEHKLFVSKVMKNGKGFTPILLYGIIVLGIFIVSIFGENYLFLGIFLLLPIIAIIDRFFLESRYSNPNNITFESSIELFNIIVFSIRNIFFIKNNPKFIKLLDNPIIQIILQIVYYIFCAIISIAFGYVSMLIAAFNGPWNGEAGMIYGGTAIGIFLGIVFFQFLITKIKNIIFAKNDSTIFFLQILVWVVLGIIVVGLGLFIYEISTKGFGPHG